MMQNEKEGGMEVGQPWTTPVCVESAAAAAAAPSSQGLFVFNVASTAESHLELGKEPT